MSISLTANSFAQLSADISIIRQGGGLAQTDTGYTITLTSVLLSETADRPVISLLAGSSLTVTGVPGGSTIDGGGVHAAFRVLAGTVQLNGLLVRGGLAQGGAGAPAGGGGGAGLGGGLYVGTGATVTLRARFFEVESN